MISADGTMVKAKIGDLTIGIDMETFHQVATAIAPNPHTLHFSPVWTGAGEKAKVSAEIDEQWTIVEQDSFTVEAAESLIALLQSGARKMRRERDAKRLEEVMPAAPEPPLDLSYPRVGDGDHTQAEHE